MVTNLTRWTLLIHTIEYEYKYSYYHHFIDLEVTSSMPVSTRRQSLPRRTAPSRSQSTRSSSSSSDSSSDESDDDSASTTSSTTLTSPSSSSGAKAGISLNLQKQLLSDIEAAGGLELVSLKKLCDSKPDIYGQPASELRRRVQNKVNYWHRLPAIEFQKFLHLLSPSTESSHSRTPPRRRSATASSPSAQPDQPASRSKKKKGSTMSTMSSSNHPLLKQDDYGECDYHDAICCLFLALAHLFRFPPSFFCLQKSLMSMLRAPRRIVKSPFTILQM